MKHVFVVNPCAGGRDCTAMVAEQLQRLRLDSSLYVTRTPRDATHYVRQCLVAEGRRDVRFYACGGDGTLNEVVAGALEAAATLGTPLSGLGVEVACMPCGSGNDYIKCWPESDFSDLAALVDGTATPVDAMHIGSRYGLNVLNFGFEAEVCRTMERVRRWPLLGGRMAYATGILHCLLRRRHNPCRISVDDQPWHDGDLLLASAANGRFVGGGYQCAPHALPDDGWFDIMCVDSIGIPRFLSIIGDYRRGLHLDKPDLDSILHHCRGHRVCFESDRHFSIVIDGELLEGNRFVAECLPKAVPFVIPKH